MCRGSRRSWDGVFNTLELQPDLTIIFLRDGFTLFPARRAYDGPTTLPFSLWISCRTGPLSSKARMVSDCMLKLYLDTQYYTT
jgi:hypothetical protein